MKKDWSCAYTPPVCFHGVDTDKFIFPLPTTLRSFRFLVRPARIYHVLHECYLPRPSLNILTTSGKRHKSRSFTWTALRARDSTVSSRRLTVWVTARPYLIHIRCRVLAETVERKVYRRTPCMTYRTAAHRRSDVKKPGSEDIGYGPVVQDRTLTPNTCSSQVRVACACLHHSHSGSA